MVTYAATHLDAVFAALADATRRSIVERLLAGGELSAGEIARPLQMSFPAVSRHIRVLEEAGIVERRIERQWRYVRIQPKALMLAEGWLADQRRQWSGALEGLTAAQIPEELDSSGAKRR